MSESAFKSKQTTIAGALAFLAAMLPVIIAATGVELDSAVVDKAAIGLMGIATFFGFGAARDHSVSSEDAGLK